MVIPVDLSKSDKIQNFQRKQNNLFGMKIVICFNSEICLFKVLIMVTSHREINLTYVEMKFTIIWIDFDTNGNKINIPNNNIAKFSNEINDSWIKIDLSCSDWNFDSLTFLSLHAAPSI